MEKRIALILIILQLANEMRAAWFAYSNRDELTQMAQGDLTGPAALWIVAELAFLIVTGILFARYLKNRKKCLTESVE